MTRNYYFYGDAAEVRVEVTSTMEALGDQPYFVHLYDLGDDLVLNEEAIVTEASSPLRAAANVTYDWLVSQGLPLDGDFKLHKI